MIREVLILIRKEYLECFRELRSFSLFLLFCSFFFPQFVIFGSPKISSAILEDTLKAEVVNIGIKGNKDLVSFILKKNERVAVVDLKDQDPVPMIKKGKLDLVILMPKDLGDKQGTTPGAVIAHDAASSPAQPTETKDGSAPEMVVLYDAQKESSLSWVIHIASELSTYNEQLLKHKFKAMGIKEAEFSQPEVTYKSISNSEESDSSAPLGRTLPLVALFFISTVGISGAIGGVSIERETKRMLYLLLTPVKRSSIMFSLLTVITSLSLIPIVFGTFATEAMFEAPPLASKLAAHGLNITITFSDLVTLVLMSIPLALSIVSTSLYFSTFFRTSQQARGYSLLYMVAVNALSSWILSLNLPWPILVLLPVVNMAQCMRGALMGAYEWPWIALSSIWSLVFAYFVTIGSSKLLAREDLLLGVDHAPKPKGIAKLLPSFDGK